MYISFILGPGGNLISTELWVSVRPWCAHYPCQTLPWALFSTPLRMQYIRWKTLGRKHNVWAVMPSPLPQSCLLPLFFPICSETHSSSNFAEFLFILWVCNILPHCENTFAGNNPIIFHFCGTFYCYLLFPCTQNPELNFFPLPWWCLALLKWFYETQLGQEHCWNSLKIWWCAHCDLKVAQLEDLVKRDIDSECSASQRQRGRENTEGWKECNIGGERESIGSKQTAFINSICFCKRVWLCDLCRMQPSSIIFTHYARADKIQADTCLLRERLNNKWILWNFVNLLSVSW